MASSPSTSSSVEFSPDAGDLGPLAWVLEETRKSIQTATKALKRFAHEAESARGVDLASVDASQLRVARQQLHQVAGALEMVGQDVAAHMVRGMESAAQQFVARPETCSESAAAALERCGFALLEFVQDQMTAQPRSALGLFPQFRQVQEMAGADRIHPADLWPVGWRWLTPAVPAAAQPLACDAAVRQRLDHNVLKVMRHGEKHAAAELATISLSLAAGAAAPRVATFWNLAAGFFEALAQGLLPADVYVKRAASRVLLQYASLARGDENISERLTLDLLFFCAQSRPQAGDDVPVLRAVRQCWDLDTHEPVAYEVPVFGLYDPAVLAQARRRIDSIKENWSALAGGDIARLKPCVDQLGLVIESLERLHEQGKPLAQALGQLALQLQQSGQPPSPELAIETATTVLFLEASFDDFRPQDSVFAARMQQLADRLNAVREGAHAPGLEPWMEELYRSVSDKQTMGTVVGELRVTLGEVEQRLDQYFRHPADPAPLDAVPGLMAQMRGVLSVLGLDQAALAVGRLRERVERLRESAPDAADAAVEFEKLGNSLGAFGFLIDTLSYQPALARQLFVYDEQTDEFRYLAGRIGRTNRTPGASLAAPLTSAPGVAGPVDGGTTLELGVSAVEQFEQLAARAALDERPALAEAAKRAAEAARSDDDASLSSALQALEITASQRAADDRVVPSESGPADGQDDDDDLQAIFLEEADEVLASGAEAVLALSRTPSDLDSLITLRRVFHTLKGSSRMVGLAEFGAAAWSVEQLLNVWLAEQKPVDDDLRAVAGDALTALGLWVEDIAAHRAQAWRAEPFDILADGLRLQSERRAVSLVPAARDTAAGAADSAGQAAGEPAALDVLVGDAVATDAPESEPEADRAAGAEALESPEPWVRLELPSLELLEMDGLDAAAASREQPGGSLEDGTLDWSPAIEPVDSAEAPELDEAQLRQAFDLPGLELSDLELIDAASALPESDDSLDVELESLGAELEPLTPDTTALQADTDWPLAFEAAEAESKGPAEQPPEAAEFALDLMAVQAAADEVIGLDRDGAGTPPDLGEPAEAQALEAPEGADETTTGGASESAVIPPIEDGVREIGGLRISTALYNVYLSEADTWSDQLIAELSDWAGHLDAPIPERAIACAHSLAGSSATVGFAALSELARGMEHALDRLQGQTAGTPQQADVLGQAAEDIRRVLHQFAAGVLKEPAPGLLAAVQALEPEGPTGPAALAEEHEPQPDPVASEPVPEPESEPVVLPAGRPVFEHTPESGHEVPLESVQPPHELDDGIDAEDVIDPDLFPIFEEEADELLPRLSAALRQWVERPDELAARAEALRVLHTLKGSARLAGALRLGEMAHRTESVIESLGTENLSSVDVAPLPDYHDRLLAEFQRLRDAAHGEPMPAVGGSVVEPTTVETATDNVPELAEEPTPIERGSVAEPTAFSFVTARVQARQTVRVRAQLLDRLMAQAGEVMTARARLESDVTQLRALQGELASNVERLRGQLRDVELQAETQMQSRLAQSRDAQRNFDPLEFDRFTRMQELTRMMAESVNDVATVQRNLQRLIDSSEDDLIAQARQSRELQGDLLRTRMVEFDGISERLYRVVRQAAKESDKQVRLDIVGGGIEMDRGILDRMTPAFEHLLRNSVVHGIEAPAERLRRGKDATGLITIEVHQAGNDVTVEFRDDGAGLDLPRIQAQALARGLIDAGQVPSDAELSQLIFTPGFTTAEVVTEIAGRGVGADVVHAEVQALGGRIETRTETGLGAAFKLVLPLTTAVTQVVMIRTGDLVVGVPASLVEVVLRGADQDLERAYRDQVFQHNGEAAPFFWAGALLQHSARSSDPLSGKAPVLILRSAAQRVALHVDEVLGNQEVVVKALGPQLSRLPGLVSITALPSGAVVLLYNPVALAAVYGERARALGQQASAVAGDAGAADGAAVAPPSQIPLVLVVDDSITVRRVTQRLLQREGYRVALAADGLQGLERLHQERPAVVLSDIEMPRMDGFDFLRNIRADEALRELPVVMITSRIAEKHREHARELGANHYLGKPYSEDELLGLIRTYARVEEPAPVL